MYSEWLELGFLGDAYIQEERVAIVVVEHVTDSVKIMDVLEARAEQMGDRRS